MKRTLSSWYAYYNRKFFANRLPPPVYIGFRRPTKGDCMVGETSALLHGELLVVGYVRIHPVLRRLDALVLSTVLHEMIHIELVRKRLPARCKRNPYFTAELHRLFEKGAYEGLL